METPIHEEPPATDMNPTDAQEACFEAGVKFGSLYHQFAGAPVSVDSAASLAAAVEESIENQPACESVTVDADLDAIEAAAGDVGYTEFTGPLFEAEVVVEHEGVEVVARMAMDDGYPLMEVVEVRD
jgi:hypothetical protein